MVKIDKKRNVEKFDVSSKFWRVFLVIVTVFLVFAGPTYISYLLLDVLNLDYFVSIATGFALFVAGLLLMWFLARRKIIA
jgi:hypothetical protein